MTSGGNRVRYVTVLICFPVVCAFLIALGAHEMYESAYGLAHRYDTLSSRGVRADASLVKCAPGIGGGRGIGCRVHLQYGPLNRTWDYPEDSAQFGRLRPGDPLSMLVDPAHPTVAYTVHDVEARTNTGLGPVFFVGAAFVLFGLAGLGWFARLWWTRRSR